jgi:transketolase
METLGKCSGNAKKPRIQGKLGLFKPIFMGNKFTQGAAGDRAGKIMELEEIAHQIRVKLVKIFGRFGSGHIGGALSTVEMLTVLYFHEMNYDPENILWEDRDRFILSKGHGSFTQYVALARLGVFPEEVLNHPYEIDSPMQGHPEYGICPGVEVSSGALGQGLSVGVGMALGARMKDKSFRVYAVLGDGELNEGQIWEAIMLAAGYKLDNLVAFVDNNGLCLTDNIEKVLPFDRLDNKFEAFGWNVITIDGHSVEQIYDALEKARTYKGKPTAIIAKTIKGQGISFLENKAISHSTTLSRTETETALRELGCSQEEIAEVFSGRESVTT